MGSHTKRHRTDPGNYSFMRAPSLREVAALSAHVAEFGQHRASCARCRSSISLGSSQLVKHWLEATCQEILVGAVRPYKLPIDTVIILGKQVTHHSPNLYVYRGLLYCIKCGARGEHMLKKLVSRCEQPLSCKQSFGKSTIDRINKGRKVAQNIESGSKSVPEMA